MARPKLREGLKKTETIKVLVTASKKAAVLKAAVDVGYASTADYINAAIDEKMQG